MPTNTTTWDIVEVSIGIFLTSSIFLGIGMMLFCIACFKPDYYFRRKSKAVTTIFRSSSASTLENADFEDERYSI
jgi:hypothetical protein